MTRTRTTAVLATLLLVTAPMVSAPAEAATDRAAVTGHIETLDGGAFPLAPDWSLDAEAAQLEAAMGTRQSLATVLDSANRSTTACTTSETEAQPEHYDRTDIPLAPDQILYSVDRFCWNTGDSEVSYWVPQGVTGSADADDDGLWGPDKVLAVSWHYDQAKAGTTMNKGVRVSFVDRVSGMYRHVLLVEPTGTADFKAVPIHAGGLAWLGRYLYVADTSRGLRVFDMERILEVSTGQPDLVGEHDGAYYAFDYRYVLPQVATYYQSTFPPSPCVPEAVDALCFSSLALDRSTTPDTLVVGEYRSGRSTAPAVDGGRVVRYPVDASADRKLTLTAGKAVPYDAVTMPVSNVQGVQTWDGNYYLGRSSATEHSFLYSGSVGSDVATHSWAIGGEDMYHEHGTGLTAGVVWTATEHAYDDDGNLIDRRVVFAVPLNTMS